jgi:hypothetical protein
MKTVAVDTTRFTIWDREDWQIPSRPVKGPVPFPNLVSAVMCHYPGASPGWKPPTDVAAHLRWAHDLYLVSKGFSYGYSYVIGPNPVNWRVSPISFDVWEVRGLDIRPAANNGDFPPYSLFANPNWNGHTVPIQIICSDVFPPTPDQRLQFRWMVAWLDHEYGQTLDVFPHRKTDSTNCPGPVMPIDDLAVRPTQPLPPPQPPSTNARRKGPLMDAALLAHEAGSATFWVSLDGGYTRQGMRSEEHVRSLFATTVVKDAKSKTALTLTNWGGASVLSSADLTKFMGPAVA